MGSYLQYELLGQFSLSEINHSNVIAAVLFILFESLLILVLDFYLTVNHSLVADVPSSPRTMTERCLLIRNIIIYINA